jgi:transposase
MRRGLPGTLGLSKLERQGTPVQNIPRLGRPARRRLIALGRASGDPATAARFQVIALLATGRSHRDVADNVGVCLGLVSRVKRRYLEHGVDGLYDRRRNNGKRKVDAAFVAELRVVLARSPAAYGWQRPTWTRELLALEMGIRGFASVSACTVGRALRHIGARLGAAKPIVRCPWTKARRQDRVRELTAVADAASDDEPVLYVDEVDIHLNPKIGRDWMLPGTQRLITTPGKNEKYYLAGALDVRRRRLVVTGSEAKSSQLFCDLLHAVAAKYRRARRIHLILDNYIIHKSGAVQRALAALGGRVRLHFLPPYCPQHNKIERLWRDLHANVTRNHRCATIAELLDRVRSFIDAYNNDPALCSVLRMAA